MIAETIPQLSELTTEEKLLLSNELWAEANAEMGEEGPDPVLIAKLQERLKEYQENPNDVVAWETIKCRIANRKDG